MPKTKRASQSGRAHKSRQTSAPDLFEQFVRLSPAERQELLTLLRQLGPERAIQALKAEVA